MGFVQIKKNKGEGLYAVEVLKDLSRAIKNKKKLVKELESLKGIVTSQLNNRLATSNEILNAINSDINNVLNTSVQEGKKFDEIQKLLAPLLIEQSEERVNNDTLLLQKAELEYIISAKEKMVKLLTDVIENRKDLRDVWATDYAVDFKVDDIVISLEINRENKGILTAPHTYNVSQDDIDLINKVIAIKEAEILRLEENLLELQEEIETNKAVTSFERTQLTTLLTLEKTNKNLAIIDTQKEKVIALIFEGQRLKQLKVELIRLIKEKKKNLDRSQVFKAELVAAFAKVDKIFIPQVNKFSTFLQPVLSSSPQAVVFNKSMLPGVQRWRPTYRGGKITAIDYEKDTCTVLFYPAASSQQRLNINYDTNDPKNGLQPVYENVPIRYGDCNAAVFVIDDDVTLLFKEEPDASGKALLYEPTVVGFVTEPKECLPLFVVDIALGTLPDYLFDPFEQLKIFSRNNSLAVQLNQPVVLIGGAIDYRNQTDQISWDGPRNRFFEYGSVLDTLDDVEKDRHSYTSEFYSYTHPNGGQPVLREMTAYVEWNKFIYSKGKVLFTAPELIPLPGADPEDPTEYFDVLGVGIFKDRVVLLANDNRERWQDELFIWNYETNVWDELLSIDYRLLAGAEDNDLYIYRNTPAFFNSDSSRCILAVDKYKGSEIFFDNAVHIRPLIDMHRFYYILSLFQDDQGNITTGISFESSSKWGPPFTLISPQQSSTWPLNSTFEMAKDWFTNDNGVESINTLTVSIIANMYSSVVGNISAPDSATVGTNTVTFLTSQGSTDTFVWASGNYAYTEIPPLEDQAGVNVHRTLSDTLTTENIDFIHIDLRSDTLHYRRFKRFRTADKESTTYANNDPTTASGSVFVSSSIDYIKCSKNQKQTYVSYSASDSDQITSWNGDRDWLFIGEARYNVVTMSHALMKAVTKNGDAYFQVHASDMYFVIGNQAVPYMGFFTTGDANQQYRGYSDTLENGLVEDLFDSLYVNNQNIPDFNDDDRRFASKPVAVHPYRAWPGKDMGPFWTTGIVAIK